MQPNSIKKTYTFIIVTYTYYLNINPNTILKIISKHQLLFIYTSYSILDFHWFDLTD